MKSTPHDPTVRHRFSAAASSYDRHADAQRLAAEHLLTCLPDPESVRTLLEVGCGTGYLTGALTDRFPGAAIHALDLSSTMVKAAQTALPGRENLHWHVSDVANFRTETKFDLLASNAALHWIEPRHAAFEAAARLLRPGGILAGSMMVHGTLRELHETRLRCAPHKPPHQLLPRTDELEAALRASRFGIQLLETRSYRTRHPSAGHLLTALHDMGLTGGPVSRSTTPLNRGELQRLVDTYQERFGAANGEVFATYEVTFLRAERKP